MAGTLNTQKQIKCINTLMTLKYVFVFVHCLLQSHQLALLKFKNSFRIMFILSCLLGLYMQFHRTNPSGKNSAFFLHSINDISFGQSMTKLMVSVFSYPVFHELVLFVKHCSGHWELTISPFLDFIAKLL